MARAPASFEPWGLVLIFKAFGPIELPRRRGVVSFHAETKGAFIERALPQVAQANGCYVFAVSSGPRALPWYVGKAECMNLGQESVEPHKIEIYNYVLAENNFIQNGRPLLYYYCKMTAGGKFSRSPADVKFLENYLIGVAYTRNRRLANTQQTRHIRNLRIEGLLNDPPGGLTNCARELVDILIG